MARRKVSRSKAAPKTETAAQAEVGLMVAPLIQTVSVKVVAKAPYSAQGIDVFVSRQIEGDGDPSDVIDELTALVHEKVAAYAEEHGLFDGDDEEEYEEDEESEEEDEDEEDDAEDEDEDDDDGDEEEDEDEEDEDEDEEEGDEYTEEEILKMKKAELLELIEEEELDVDPKGMKIKELRTAVADEYFGDDDDEEEGDEEEDDDFDDGWDDDDDDD